ncbi:hypothetical protein RFI_22762 [Reticulomyxa filosa]|uniref:Uncharacterized protein n=1 Tax=Reticulomyxa filosa TaxID=46433 RepID=X6MKR7_RETFI|nr:hypothetical protein RFI_22762 [Reticulomyxa filosa]|eukprot:ETO14608.1 hypothetical protein RFI_22762 [Reticulomyxa filosa]
MEERIEKIEMEMGKKLETLEKKNEELTSMVFGLCKKVQDLTTRWEDQQSTLAKRIPVESSKEKQGMLVQFQVVRKCEEYFKAADRPSMKQAWNVPEFQHALIRVDRQLFVDKREDPYSRYQSCSIGLGVNLSSPDIHCHVLNLLKDKLLISSGQEKEKDKDANNIRFLEVGCGTGYLCCLAAMIWTYQLNKNRQIEPKAFGIEFHPELIAQAQKNAASIGLTQLVEYGTMNCHPNQWRANIGWAEKGPFDAIYCGAAVTRDDVFTLKAQLKNEGILITVVEDEKESSQSFVRIVRKGISYSTDVLFPVMFKSLAGRLQHL